MSIKKIITFYLYLFWIPFALAQPAQESYRYNIKQISQKEGFVQGTVTAIIKDNAGFMWFGSQVGLTKYDGYNFTVYTNDASDSTSLSDSFIQSLYQDNEGLIWVGGAIKGLSSLNPYTGKVVRYKLNVHLKNEGQDKVNCITEDKNGIVWIGTNAGGLFYSDKTKAHFKPFDIKSNHSTVTSLHCDKTNTIWASTDDNGLIEINYKGSPQNAILSFHNFNTDENKNTSAILSSCFDLAENIWLINGSNTIMKKEFNSNNFTFYTNFYDGNETIANIKIKAIFCDKGGNVWIGTSSDGVFVKLKESNVFTKINNDKFLTKSSSCNNIICISDDKKGSIWLGTLSCGLLTFDVKDSFFKNYNQSLNSSSQNSESISAIFVDEKETVWKGKVGLGLDYKLMSENKFSRFIPKYDLTKGKGLDYINSIEEDAENLYFGSYSQGIMYFQKRSETLNYLKSESEKKIATTSAVKFNKNIVFGTWGHGIYFIPQNNEKPQLLNSIQKTSLAKLNDVNINCLAVFKEKYLLVGTEKGGLNVFDINFNLVAVLKNIQGKNSISNNYVVCATVDKQSRVWLGNYNTGVDVIFNFEDYILNKTNDLNIVNFNKKQKICDNLIVGIVPDNINNVWLCTVNGLCMMNFKPRFYNENFVSTLTKSEINELLTIKNFNVNDGLPSNEFNTGAYYQSKNGEIYLGTTNGVFSFKPVNTLDKIFIPPVVFTKFKIFEKDFYLDTLITYKKRIELSYNQSFFSFDFCALNFSISETNQYAYMMEGFDKDWIYSGYRRFASYTNLDPGEYTFKVKACNNDGVWNEKGSSVKISIIPPWYKTTWAKFLFVILAVALFYSYIKWREISLKAEKKELEEKVDERTKEIAIINSEITKKNQDITDSINYARRIQQAILPPLAEIQESIFESFVLYHPKDIVSGDFYWFHKNEDENGAQLLLAAADCTGHGVPGAFMSMISIDKLNEAVKYSLEPSEILRYLNLGIKSALRQSSDYEKQTHDGLDIVLVKCVEDSNNEINLCYAGANRPLWILRKDTNLIEEIKPTKAGIAGYTEDNQVFQQKSVKLKKGDMFYIFTDGYVDQFGGLKNKKYMSKKLMESIISISILPMYEQKEILNHRLFDWKGNNEQVDDILIIGVRV